jgi:hypothetical protein
MRKILLGALTALMITSANAAENTDTTNYMLPGCKLSLALQLAQDRRTLALALDLRSGVDQRLERPTMPFIGSRMI